MVHHGVVEQGGVFLYTLTANHHPYRWELFRGSKKTESCYVVPNWLAIIYIYIYAYNYINQSANPGLGLHNPCVYNWYTYYMCESIKQSPKLILSLLSSKEVSISINFLKACTHPRPWFIIFVPRLLANFGANDFDLAPSAIKSRAKPTSLWLDGFLQDQAIFPKCLLSTILREFFMLSPPKRQRITKTWRCCWMHQRKATEVQVQW